MRLLVNAKTLLDFRMILAVSISRGHKVAGFPQDTILKTLLPNIVCCCLNQFESKT